MLRPRRGLSLGLAAGLIGGLALLTPWGQRLEERVGLDWLFALRGPVAAPAEAVVVAIDRASVDWLRDLPAERGQWPAPLADCLPAQVTPERLRAARRASDWPRHLHACAVDALTRAGAAAIVYDIAFVDQREPGEDEALAAALARSGRVALLQPIERITIPAAAGSRPLHYDLLVSPIERFADAAAALAPFPLPQDTARVSKFWLYKESVGDRPTLPVVAMQLQAQAALRAFAARVGEPGETGLAQLADLFRRELAASGEPVPDQLLRIFGGGAVDPQIIRRLAQLGGLFPGARERWLNFYGGPGTIAAVPFRRLLAEPDPAALDLAGKVAFVGVSDAAAAGHDDRYYTVWRRADAGDLSGVEIAASAYLNLATGAALRPLESWAAVFAAALFGLAAGLAAWRVRVSASLVGSGAVAGSYLLLAHLAFARAVWIPVAVPILLQLPLTLLFGRLLQHVAALRWLETYVPQAFARRLVGGEADGALAEAEVTVMFTDVARFSAFAERASPGETAGFLNEHFALLGACVAREGGFVDKFIGDSLMAFWTARDHGPDHALHAARAARAIAAAVAEDNRRRRDAGRPPVGVRIGLHSGTATLGNIGGGGRRNYTVVGDTVNVGQRLEELSKSIAPDGAEVAILLSESTAAALDGAIATISAGRHRIRGRSEALDVYTFA